MGYRSDWFDNNSSNHGWYTCVRCGKKLRKGGTVMATQMVTWRCKYCK